MTSNLDKAIAHFGTKKNLAEKLGVSGMVVYQWSKRKVPAERALQIQMVTSGEVKACDLRPDLFFD